MVGRVVIGVDPHKRLNAVVVIDEKGKVLARVQFPNSAEGFKQLKAFWGNWAQRCWAVEGASGVGRSLAQRLVAEGESVLDVPTARSALVRVYGGGNGRKNDDTDALSVARAGLNSTDLLPVRPDGAIAALRLITSARTEVVKARVQALNRIHRDLAELVAGGAKRDLSARQAQQILARLRPRDELGKLRRRLLADQIAELVAIDKRLGRLDKELAAALEAMDTSLTSLFGLGPVSAATIIGQVGDVTRFATAAHFASYNGTAPVDTGSGGPPVPRLNTKGNRKLNAAIHVMAVTQIRSPQSPGHAYYQRKLAEKKTPREATRALKRRLSDVIYRQLVLDATGRDPGGQVGTAPKTSVTGSTPTTGSSAKPQPGSRIEASPLAVTA